MKSTDGVIIKTVQHQHPTIHILLPQDVNECDLNVAISAENRAGVSIPTEIPIGKLITTFCGSDVTANLKYSSLLVCHAQLSKGGIYYFGH